MSFKQGAKKKNIDKILVNNSKRGGSELSKRIKYICCKCGGKNVDIMSVVERTINSDNKKIPTVDITYICTDCGNSESKNEFLYKTNE